MAKKASGNKSQAIRDALAANPDKSPKDIAEGLKSQGYQVNAQYVSTIKSNANTKAARKVTVRRQRTAALAATASSELTAVDSALAFIKAAGGLSNAKQMLATVEQISQILK